MFGIGTGELLIILLIILILFGGAKLPELSRSIGVAIKELREGVKDGVEDDSGKSTKVSKTSRKNKKSK